LISSFFEGNALETYLRDPTTSRSFIKTAFLYTFGFAFLIYLFIRTYEIERTDPTEFLQKYSDFSDSDIQSKINEIKEIRVKTNNFQDKEMIVVLNE
jgi:hypothetical protein